MEQRMIELISGEDCIKVYEEDAERIRAKAKEYNTTEANVIEALLLAMDRCRRDINIDDYMRW